MTVEAGGGVQNWNRCDLNDIFLLASFSITKMPCMVLCYDSLFPRCSRGLLMMLKRCNCLLSLVTLLTISYYLVGVCRLFCLLQTSQEKGEFSSNWFLCFCSKSVLYQFFVAKKIFLEPVRLVWVSHPLTRSLGTDYGNEVPGKLGLSAGWGVDEMEGSELLGHFPLYSIHALIIL